ncbi:SixA phosphatase family protein [Rhizobium sp. TRM95796]|uniref:SixA phosphatase family protein n=1 Tax=Rhizobium sp. TRM95796 TaxID=2979862 RepID=UPI0021E89896|nr:histidine phosphatase family protein [Rhizobium sp. TRM95796]MCV3767525.1 histidine phosphatase family protein [Rhizobium sp. TRM95796]
MTEVPAETSNAAPARRSDKRLILLRHAKSAWPDGVEDRLRPLADRGRRAAPLMGATLAKRRLTPDLVLVSPARRTEDTWSLVRKLLPETTCSQTEDRIYEASAETLLAVVHETKASIKTLMIIGHNPGLEDLARRLLASREGEHAERLLKKYPTAGLAVFDFEGADWSAVQPGKGRLKAFVTPKSLAGKG